MARPEARAPQPPVDAGRAGAFELAPALGLHRILDEEGHADPSRVPPLPRAEWLALYRWMLVARTGDERLLALQRQGRIGFYAECKGQEATVFGTAAALGAEDWIVPALREAWAGVYHGLPMKSYFAQLFGNANDPACGHQMPCHPGTRATRYLTMSSCIASQLPHATGLAWAAKIRKDPVVVAAYLGEGATSEGDFHVAVNFAAVQQTPVVFVCQNNQWAISTPSELQSRSATYAMKAAGYGIPGVRVDGNDLFAVYDAMRTAVERARAGGGPTLLECLSYRMGAHTSSDDPSRYRDERVTEQWKSKDPIARLRKWLVAERLLDDAADAAMRAQVEAEVREAIAIEESAPLPPLSTMFDHVFAERPRHLDEQLAELEPMPRQKLGGVHQ